MAVTPARGGQRVRMAVAVGACVMAAACGRDGPDRATTSAPGRGVTTAPATTKVVDQQSSFTIGPVLSQVPPPCSPSAARGPGNRVLAATQNGNVRCYVVGTAIIDANDVTDAVASAEPTGGWEVVVSFTADATARMNALTQRQGVGNQIAIVVDGQVVGTPTVLTTNFPGKAVVTGLDQPGAQDLARRLHHA